MVVGRPAQNRADGERLAEVIGRRAVTAVRGEADGRWPTRIAASGWPAAPGSPCASPSIPTRYYPSLQVDEIGSHPGNVRGKADSRLTAAGRAYFIRAERVGRNGPELRRPSRRGDGQNHG